MTDNINPSHYKDGPFECIELSRLLSSDWGQAVQYCFRWQHKNGVEDLKKALWFVNDALASRQWKELVDEYKGKDTK